MLPRSLALSALLLTSLAAGLAVATDQPTARPAKPPASIPAPKPAPAINPAEFAANAVARVAFIDLRLRKDVQPEDFRVAMHLLSLAEQIQPTEVEFARRRVEAAWSAGDIEQAIESTRKVVTLDPSDTVAQLRLISTLISEKQTVEERLALQSKFLTGPQAAKLDPSVRSRIAVDAALLSKERGDEKGFSEFLKQAVTLDSSNKEAALLALSYYAEKGANAPLGRLDLVANLLMADPLDPNVLRQMATELAGLGAFKQAIRFYDASVRALAVSAQPAWPAAEVEHTVLEWQLNGVGTAITTLNEQLAFKRRQTERIAKNQEKVGSIDIVNPADVRLDFETDRARAVAAWAAEDRKTLTDALTALAQSAAFRREISTDDSKRPPSISREDAKRQADQSIIQVQLSRALFSVDVDKIDADLASLKDLDEESVPRSKAVPLIRDALAAPERAAELQAQLHALAGDDELLVAITHLVDGMVSTKLGRTDEARAAFTTLATKFPLTEAGAAGRTMMQRLSRSDWNLSPLAAEAAKKAEAIPNWVDRAAEQPRLLMSLSLVTTEKAKHLVAYPVTLVVRNFSSVPLAVGPDRPINSRMLFGPGFATRWPLLSQAVQPEVIDAARRLRLLPGEEMRIRCCPELGLVGLLSELACGEEVRLNWRVLQGFVQGGLGALLEGPGCLTAESRTIARDPIPEAAWTVADVVDRLGSVDEESLPLTLAVARRWLWAEAIGIPPKELDIAQERAAAEARAASRTQIVDALVKAFPELPVNSRIAIVAALPHAGQVAEMAPLDEAIKKDQDDHVRTIALVTRVRDSADPFLDACEGSADPMVAAIAKTMRARLQGSGICYAKLGPGLASMRGTLDASKADGDLKSSSDKPAESSSKPGSKPDGKSDTKADPKASGKSDAPADSKPKK